MEVSASPAATEPTAPAESINAPDGNLDPPGGEGQGSVAKSVEVTPQTQPTAASPEFRRPADKLPQPREAVDVQALASKPSFGRTRSCKLSLQFQ